MMEAKATTRRPSCPILLESRINAQIFLSKREHLKLGVLDRRLYDDSQLHESLGRALLAAQRVCKRRFCVAMLTLPI